DRRHRRLLDRDHASLGTAALRRPVPRVASGAVPRVDPCGRAFDRPPRPRSCIGPRPLPRGKRLLTGARVPGLDDHRDADPVVVAPGLDPPDLLGARADVGHARRQARCAWRRRRDAASRVRPAERRLRRACDRPHPPLRAPRARARNPFALMRAWLRVFFIGGAISFRALFAWIRPWVYIPTLVVGATPQGLFFAFLGRTAHLEDDAWFVVGNAVQSASLAALFGMGFAIDGERWMQTLSEVLATTANPSALFLGRPLPVLLNAAVAAATGFIGGAVFLGFRTPLSSLPGLTFLVVLG